MNRNPLRNTKGTSSFMIYLNGAACMHCCTSSWTDFSNHRIQGGLAKYLLQLSAVVIMVLICNNVILLIGVSIFVFEKELFEWSRTQSGGNETAEYSYFHNGCQLQCVLLLMCKYVIARAWRSLFVIG